LLNDLWARVHGVQHSHVLSHPGEFTQPDGAVTESAYFIVELSPDAFPDVLPSPLLERGGGGRAPRLFVEHSTAGIEKSKDPFDFRDPVTVGERRAPPQHHGLLIGTSTEVMPGNLPG